MNNYTSKSQQTMLNHSAYGVHQQNLLREWQDLDSQRAQAAQQTLSNTVVLKSKLILTWFPTGSSGKFLSDFNDSIVNNQR
jgi:hypothetical protein